MRHYQRRRRSGTTRLLTPEQRFWLRVVKTPGPCWLWVGAVREGHGYWRGRKAHRVAYEYLMGPLGDREVEQTCGNRLCVRPAHQHVTARRSAR